MFQRGSLAFMLIMIIYLIELHPYHFAVDGSKRDLAYVLVGPDDMEQIIQTVEDDENSNRTIAVEGNNFTLNGRPLHIISGSLHYFRVPAVYWRDRLRKLKAVGFNSVSTYVEWSHHEPEERQYRFSGDYDVAQFIRLAAEEGLHVLLRPGPYICAERDLGGIPYWLLSKYPHIKLRSTDQNFMYETKVWLSKLFGYLSPLLNGNGGPIILVQVENEYGSYGSDMKYKIALRDAIQEHVRDNALLYTTDGTALSMIRNGAVPETVTTIDFGVGTNLKSVFKELRKVMPEGPLMNSEFYPGWLTHWGEHIQTVEKKHVVNSLKSMIDHKINVNMYVFFGGTNFEFSAGANFAYDYRPDITSYDYDAPLSEAGDPTPKYYAIRKLMEQYYPELKNITPPAPSPKGAYGIVTLNDDTNLLSAKSRSTLGRSYADVTGAVLPTFEALRQRSGLLLYETTLNDTDGILSISEPRDRIYVYVNSVFQGIIDRQLKTKRLSIKSSPGQTLSLLVENQGRINYGPKLHDYKGILSVVKYKGLSLSGKWTITGFPLEEIKSDLSNTEVLDVRNGPVLYEGKFSLPDNQQPLDTFIDPTGWGKGYMWVNGHNLGRYWPTRGPQVTLYVPGVWLQQTDNVLQVLELEQTSPNLAMNFIDYPILNKTTQYDAMDPQVLIFNI